MKTWKSIGTFSFLAAIDETPCEIDADAIGGYGKFWIESNAK